MREGGLKLIGNAMGLAALLLVGASSVTAQPSSPAIAVGQAVAGELTPNDAQRRSGKYEDVYTLAGRRGGRVDLRLSSDDFDSYLVVTGPGGFSLANDDEPGAGESLHSRLTIELPADGAYRVAVTTFRPGETGRYRLEAAQPPPDAFPGRPAGRVCRDVGHDTSTEPELPLQLAQTSSSQEIASGSPRSALVLVTRRYWSEVRPTVLLTTIWKTCPPMSISRPPPQLRISDVTFRI